MRIEINSYGYFFSKYKGTGYEDHIVKNISKVSTFEELKKMINKVNSLEVIEMFIPFPNADKVYKNNDKYIEFTKNELLIYYMQRMYWQYVIKNAMSASKVYDKATIRTEL